MPIVVVQAGATLSTSTPSATPTRTATATPTLAATATPILAATIQPATPPAQTRLWLPLIVYTLQPGVSTPTAQPSAFPTLPPIASPTPLPTATPTLSPTPFPTPLPVATLTPAAPSVSPGNQLLSYGLIILALCAVIAAILLWLYVNRKAATSAPAPIAKNMLPTYRLDAAFPDKVGILQAFDIAVAIRHLDAAVLAQEELKHARSRAKQLYLPTSKPYTQLSIHISAQQCDIKGADSIEFRLYQGGESPVFAFQVIPRIAGFINIVVTITEKGDPRGEVTLLTRSIQHFTEKPGLKTVSYAIKADLGQFLHRRLQELQERQATKGPDLAPDDLLEIEALQKQLADLAG